MEVESENPLDINPEGVKRSLRLSIWEGASYSVLVGFAEVYFIPLLLELGGTDFQVGLFVAMIQLFLGFSQFAGLALIDRIHRRKPIMLTAGIAHIIFILLMLLGVLSGKMSPFVFIILGGFYFASVGASIPSWTSLMGDLTSLGARGEYFGRRNSICQGVFFVCMLTGGGILELFDNRGIPFTGFAIILAVALFGRAGSTYAYSLFYESPYQHVKEAYFSFIDFLKRSGKANFTKFVFFLSLMNLSVQIAGPYYTAYMLKDLEFSYIQFTMVTGVFYVVMIIATRQFGLIADRYGNRVILKISGLLFPLVPLLWLVSTNFYYILFIQAIHGVIWGGWGISGLNFALDAVTPPKRARCSAYMNFTSCMGVVIGAMLGASLSSKAPAILKAVAPHLGIVSPHLSIVSPLYLVFLVASIVGFIVVLVSLPRFHEVRQVDKPDYREMIFMFTHLKPITGIRLRRRTPNNNKVD